MTRVRLAIPLAIVATAVTGLTACRASSHVSAPTAVTPAHPVSTETSSSRATTATVGRIDISAVGDTILGDTPNLPSDPAHYLSPIARDLSSHQQIVFGNLEGTLTTSTDSKCGSNSSDCFSFRNPPHYARYLARAGFTVLNDANNHSHDFGESGLRQTIKAIHHAGMKQTGLPGEITIVHDSGVRVAFVAFAPYSNTADLLDLGAAKSLIRKASHESAVVVVYMHAGAEGSDAQHVTGREEHYVGEDRGNPEKFAHLAIRSGANLVIASGPHVLRGMQFYRHRLIAYSLGNFANFHNFSGGGVLSDSGILHVSLSATGGFRAAKLISVTLDSEGRAQIGGDSVSVVRRLSREDFGHSAAHFAANGRITK